VAFVLFAAVWLGEGLTANWMMGNGEDGLGVPTPSR